MWKPDAISTALFWPDSHNSVRNQMQESPETAHTPHTTAFAVTSTVFQHIPSLIRTWQKRVERLMQAATTRTIAKHQLKGANWVNKVMARLQIPLYSRSASRDPLLKCSKWHLYQMT